MAKSASRALGNDPSTNPILHGSDLPQGSDKCVFYVETVRDAPETFNSPFILDGITVYPKGLEHKKSFPLNSSNCLRLSRIVGDDLEASVGRYIMLVPYKTTNPSTGQDAIGLAVKSVKEGPVPARMEPPKPEPVSTDEWDDVPF